MSAPTSGYSRGCTDSQIANPSDRYINQPEKGPKFHSKAFMQTYTEGFDACSHNPNDSRVKLDNTASVQKPYWTSSNATVSPDMKKYHLFLYGVDGMFQNGNENLRVCLDANFGSKHAVCHPIKGVPLERNSTVDAGYFVVPTSIVNESALSICASVKFYGVSFCKTFEGTEGRVNMETTIYNDVYAITYCLREHKTGKDFDECFKNVS